ncbi:MAG: hypothetical protein RLZZ450_2182 [Pseudomonadota bacterium]
MSDDATKKDGDLVLEWTDALDTWELDIDESATAESSPLPQTALDTPLVPAAENDQLEAIPSRRAPPPPPPAALLRSRGEDLRPSTPRSSSDDAQGSLPARPSTPRMYQPPSPAERAMLERSLQKTLPPPAELAADAAGPYNDLAAISPDLLSALSKPRSISTVQPAAGPAQVETLRPFVPRGVPDVDAAGAPFAAHNDEFALTTPPPPSADPGAEAARVSIEQALRDSVDPVSEEPGPPASAPPEPEHDAPADALELADGDEGLRLSDPDLDLGDETVPISDADLKMASDFARADTAGDSAEQPVASRLTAPQPAVGDSASLGPTTRDKSAPPSGRPERHSDGAFSRSAGLNSLLPERDPFDSTPAAAGLATPVVPVRSSHPSLEVVVESTEDDVEAELQRDGLEQAALRRRITMLEALARRQTERQAAELLVSAGELAEQLGELARAEQLYAAASLEAPKHVPPLRALIRLAFRAGDKARYVQLLERAAELPLPRFERSRLLAQLSLARWVLERDAPLALGAATEAQQLSPELLAPALLLARIESATHPAKLDSILLPLVQRTQDLALAASWLVSAGRAVEARGDSAGARALYARAAGDDPFAFDAQLSLSRTDHALGAHAESARALLRTLESFDIGPVAEAVRRRAAHMLGVVGQHAEAVELLEHASDDVSLRTAAQVALASDDLPLKLRAVEGWTLGADGAERALALLTKAELLSESGDYDGAENALELAALADPGQSLVSVHRESLARRCGNAARLAEIVAGEEAGRGALAAAAKLASSGSTAAQELRWLVEAAAEESGVAAHGLAMDASAELADGDTLRRLLRAESERGAAPARVLALLALAELERQRGDTAQRHDALQQAWELAPRDTTVLRAFARSVPRTPESAHEAAQAFRREAESHSGERAAFAYLREGFAVPAGTSERLDAFVCAAAAAPGYGPASWALHREARRQGDLPRLGELHGSEAERALDKRGRAAHLVRAALIRAGEDTDQAALQLTRALELMQEDPVLGELVLRLGDAAPSAVRVATLERMAARVKPPFRRQLVLASAGTLEDEGKLEEAAARYREVLLEYPGDPIADVGLERVGVDARRGPEQLLAKRRAVDEASSERTRARALEELMLLESDPTAALELAHELLALSPSHPLALRALERDAMTRNDRVGLASLELRFVDSGRGPRDKAARLRLAHLLRSLEPEDEASSNELDRKVLACAAAAPHSLWLSRQLLSSAIALHDTELVVRAIDLLSEQTHDPVEHASLAVQKGWLTLDQRPAELEDALREALRDYPEHPTAHELIAEVRRATRDLSGAAEQFERAGERALSDERSAHLWTQAAGLWDRQLKQPERAQRALQRAAAKDLDYPGVRERLSELLTAHGDLAGLVALTSARIAKGGSPEHLIELLRKLAELHEQRGDRVAARTALREALAHSPDSLPVWRDLARAAERAENHPERVEALGAVIRLSRDPLELRDALLELGEIHEKHIEDPVRAEAAYQRVLKLGPRNTVALERLAALYRRSGAHDLAAEALQQLARAATDPRQKRDVTLQLASWREEQNDLRGAEELLEGLRRAHPTDHDLLRALAGLLRRTNAHVALAMHLNRAVNDLRHALTEHFDDIELWRCVLDMLIERGRLDVASQCATTALALGVEAPEFHKEARTEAERQGIGAAALSELLDDLVFPESSPPSLRIVFRHAAEALNRTAPLDLRLLGAEKLDKKHPLRAVVAEQARWVAHRDIELFVSAELPYAFVPIQESPVQLLVGRALVDNLSVEEQHFLVARALKIARAQMSIACRLGPQQLELLLHGLVRSQVPSHAPSFLELSALDDAARRVGKQLSRRAQSELVPHLLELTYAGVPRFDGANVYGVVSVAGSRAGLLATSDIGSALSALIKLAGQSGGNERRTTPLTAAVAQVEEARELVSFAISEGYFEARMRAGKEGR